MEGEATMAKSRFSGSTKKKTRSGGKRSRKSSGGSGKKSNAWRAYTGGGGGKYVPSNEPIPD
jgi:hypothetical protein